MLAHLTIKEAVVRIKVCSGNEVPSFPPEVGLDIETKSDRTGLLSPQHTQLTTVQIYFPEEDKTYVVTDNFKALSRRFTEDTLYIGQGLQFDLNQIRHHLGVMPRKRFYDTLVVEGLLDAARPLEEKQRVLSVDAEGKTKQRKNAYRLDNILKRYYPEEVRGKEVRDLFIAGSSVTEEMIQYAAQDAKDPYMIRKKQMLDVARYQPAKYLLRLEHALLPIVCDMVYRGIKIDAAKWTRMAVEKEEELHIIDLQLSEYYGSMVQKDLFGGTHIDANFNSHHVIKKLLAKYGIKVDNTQRGTLEVAAGGFSNGTKQREILQLLLNRSELRILISTFGLSWLDYVSHKTDNVHWSIQQTLPETGRISAYKPNLTNIPRDMAYRECFIAGEGFVILKADYGQQEARIVADFARDKLLLDGFDAGIDPYVVVAREMFGDPTIVKADHERFVGKTIFLALVYGMFDHKLALTLGCSVTEARQHRNNFTSKFKGVYAYCEDTIARASRLHYVETVIGRRRWGHPSQSRFTGQMRNMPVQGTGADMLKLAAIIYGQKVHNTTSAYLVNMVHDELVAEVSKDHAIYYAEELKSSMLEAAEILVPNVPFTVDVDAGPYWGSKNYFTLDEKGL